MNEKEKALEEISDKVGRYKPVKHIPIFENYITFLSITLAIMLFLFPNMLVDGTETYQWLLVILPQYLWALLFFITGMMKAIGLLIDNDILRTMGLILSVIIYATFSIAYSVSFPSISFVMFVLITVFAIISIPNVKYTGIKG